MILEKGKYGFVKVGLGRANGINKNKEITIYSDDCTTKIGKAKVVEYNPLTLDIEITENLEFPFCYFTIIPMNYTQQNGYIVDIQSFKITGDSMDYKPFILSIEDNFKVKKVRKKKVIE